MSTPIRRKMKGTHWSEYREKQKKNWSGGRAAFDALPPGDKTKVFFEHHGCSIWSQAVFHTDPKQAIVSFSLSLPR